MDVELRLGHELLRVSLTYVSMKIAWILFGEFGKFEASNVNTLQIFGYVKSSSFV